jgi:hypothetical protein
MFADSTLLPSRDSIQDMEIEPLYSRCKIQPSIYPAMMQYSILPDSAERVSKYYQPCVSAVRF